MSEEQITPAQEDGENKKERVDELDVIGATLFYFIAKAYGRIKQLFVPHKTEQ